MKLTVPFLALLTLLLFHPALPTTFAGDHAKLPGPDHWAFQPVASVVPPTESTGEPHPIDAFIVQRLRQAGLELSPEADRVTLIRRLYLDMIGLPPSPEEVAAFVADDSPFAWTQLVERVLASPHYGERWARHWLDVVRFAESNGFETNHERPNAYFYRDYVIRAFNDDKPYDQFVMEQLAGDALGADEATGFIVGGAYDRVKGKDKELQAMQRQDELADMINTTGTTFLGLTLGCARCHDHKFDPVSQVDYYSLQAVFAGVQHGERNLAHDLSEGERTELRELEARQSAIRRQLADIEPAAIGGRTLIIDDEDLARVSLIGEKRGYGINPAGQARGCKEDPGAPHRLPNISGGRYTWWTNKPGEDVFAYHPGVAGRFRVWLSWGCGHETHSTDARYLLDADGDIATTGDQSPVATVDQQRFADGSGGVVKKALWSGFLDAGVHDFTEASRLVVRGGEHGTALTADVIVLQEEAESGTPMAQPRVLPPVDSRRNEERFAPIEAKVVRFVVEATNSKSQPCLDELEVFSAGENQTNVALASGGAKAASSGDYPGNEKHQLSHINDGKYGNDHSWISNENGKGWVQIEFPRPVVIDRVVWGRDREAKYDDRTPVRYRIEVADEAHHWTTVTSSAAHAPQGAPGDALAYRLPALPVARAESVRALTDESREIDARVGELTLTPVAYAGRFEQPEPTHRLYRGDPFSPKELVTPDAIESLDGYLWSLNLPVDAPEQERRLGLARWIANPRNPLTPRVMVNRVWQYHFGTGIVATPSDFGAMGFAPTHPELLDWLAAEFIREGWSIKHIHRLILTSRVYRQSDAPRSDAMAKDRGSALLWRFPSRRLSGEAIRDCIIAVTGSLDLRMNGPSFLLFEPNNNYSRNWVPKHEFGPGDMRRMVYALKLRMEQDAIFGAFDIPDAGQVCPKRARSTTPIQALNLFNSDFILDQAQRLSARIAGEAGPSGEAQIRRAFLLMFGRAPAPGELAAAVELAREHGMNAVCRALLNANEFLFLP